MPTLFQEKGGLHGKPSIGKARPSTETIHQAYSSHPNRQPVFEKEGKLGFEFYKESYTGSIREITLGSGGKAVTVGGETGYPFYQFEGEMPRKPRVAMASCRLAIFFGRNRDRSKSASSRSVKRTRNRVLPARMTSPS